MSTEEIDVVVVLHGVWKRDDPALYIDGGEVAIITITKRTRYEEFLNKLYAALPVDRAYNDLKIEVSYHSEGQALPPYAIVDDYGLKIYIRAIMKYQLALCVNVMSKAGCSYDPNMGFDDCDQFVGHEYEEEDNDEEDKCEEEPNKYDLTVNPAMLKYLNLDRLDSEKEQDKKKVPPRHYQMQPHRSSFEFNTVHDADISKPCVKIPSFHDSELIGSGQVDREDPVLPAELCMGKVFNCKKDFKTCVHIHAVNKNFEFNVSKSSPSVWYVKCTGRDCPWRIRGIRLDESDMFKVSAFTDEHTCDADVRLKDNRQATPWVVGHLIKDRLVDSGHKYQPRHIITDMKRQFGIEMKYEKAWRCREKALEYVRGTPVASYSLLPSYLYMLQLKNPGTLIDVMIDEGCEFKYCFFALGACRLGFRHCRPVICVDGSGLKSRFGGVLLVAVALDANEKLFPIAFAVVDSENNDSWVYFLTKLKQAIGDDIAELVFVSDRHQSIAHGLDVVFPESYHGACHYHLKQNIHARCKTEVCDADFTAAAYAFKESVFKRHFNNIRKLNADVAKYLTDVGFERWARVYFPSNRYNAMTSNYAESFNSTTADARTWPVTSLLEFVRARLQKWFLERRASADSSIDRLASEREKELRYLDHQAMFLQVRGINQYQLQVEDGDDSSVVHLLEKHCTCGKWQTTGMPCIHSLAAVRQRSVSKYLMCSPFYMNERLRGSYAESIFPCGPENDWNVPDEIANAIVNVPVPKASIGRPKKKLGRPKTKRIPSQGERIVQQRQCSRCHGLGHNKASCNN